MWFEEASPSLSPSSEAYVLTAVTRYFVVLNTLSRGDEASIAHFLIGFLLDHFTSLSENAFHPLHFGPRVV